MTRVAVVTGGRGAIGGAIARRLAGDGHTVVVLDRDGDVAVDLADAGQVRAAAAEVLARHGRCDVLVQRGGIVLVVSDTVWAPPRPTRWPT